MFNVFWGLIVVYICCTFIRQTELNPAYASSHVAGLGMKLNESRGEGLAFIEKATACSSSRCDVIKHTVGFLARQS